MDFEKQLGGGKIHEGTITGDLRDSEISECGREGINSTTSQLIHPHTLPPYASTDFCFHSQYHTRLYAIRTPRTILYLAGFNMFHHVHGMYTDTQHFTMLGLKADTKLTRHVECEASTSPAVPAFQVEARSVEVLWAPGSRFLLSKWN